jgi:phenylpropionate dioxygenase-like ring-hydroxylating dioxygenase large terminal subunit
MTGTPPTADFKSKFHPDPELSYTLPGYYYYDPEVYAREVAGVFLKSWLLVGYLHDLEQPGNFVTQDLLDQSVFVVRGKDGALRGFHNVCMHRGHELVKGKGSKTIFTCPYHAWSYDTEGKLKAAGNSGNVKGFDFDELSLKPVRVDTLLNMVFINFDPDARPMGELYAGLEAEVRDVLPGYDDLKLFRTDPYEFKSNWKFIFDAMECYHCPSLHPQAMGPNAYYKPSFEITNHEHWALHIIRGNPEVISGEVEGSIAYDLRSDHPIQDVYIWWMWPNIYLTVHQGNPNMKILFGMPSAVDYCWETVDNFLLGDPPSDEDISNIDNFRDNIQAQDLLAMESQQRGVHSLGYTQGRLMVDPDRSWSSEHGVHHFNKMVWEIVNGPNYEVDVEAG